MQASTSATVNSVLADVNSENYQADAGLSEETSDLPENDKANELNSESASSSINDEQSTTTTEQTEVNDDKKAAVTDDSNSTGAESEQVDNFSDNQTESILDTTNSSHLTDESQNVNPEITANDNQKLVAERRATGNATDEVTSATLTNKGFDIQYNQTIPAGAKIMFAVWSEVNGQDDLIWYTADSNGHVVAKYTGSYGKYNIHTYQNINGQMIGLNDRTIDVPKPSAKVTITMVDGTTYKVTVSDIPAYITSIQLPTWTEKGGQDDIQWYSTTKNADGTFTRIFSIAEHNLEGDKYNVHVYGTNAVTNSLTCLTGTSIEADYHFSDVHVQPTLTINGIQISMPSDVSSDLTVYHAVWSDVNDQDDIRWYDATTSGSNATGLINIANHSGTGTYHIHVYQSDNGQMYFLTSTEFTVKRTNFNTPYYNQRDGRWANITFGGYRMASTACAPTSVAMLVSSLTGTEILPTTVCAYLYNNTVEFNRGDAGTTGRGVVIAAQHWGMTATVLHSSSQLSAALKEGHHVLAAIQQDKFSPWGFGISHEIVLKGYSNGNTYVYDPYNAANNGWYPIEWIWREQSTQSGDINGLGNSFVKVTNI